MDYTVKKCEKIDMKSPNRMWNALPSMKEGRFWLNPCLFNECEYLCCSESFQIEVFFPQTNYFLPLQFQLPEDSPCYLYVHNNLLVMHSYQFISKFAAGQAAQLIQYFQARAQTSVYKYSNSQPVVNPVKVTSSFSSIPRC